MKQTVKPARRLTYAQAVAIQNRLRERLVLETATTDFALVAGSDVAFTAARTRAVAGMVLFTWPDLEVVDIAVAVREVDFPYIPGLLSFREIPAILAAYRRLSARPDLIFCDGQGIAHPRRFGLASHLGVILDTPTVGCAKSVLTGEFREVGTKRGARSRMLVENDCVGYALRTRDNVRPMYVSPGHLIDAETAVTLALKATRGYRLPEPTRAAHNLVALAKANAEK
ncbi:MAG: deoxyribonuclease V [Planctomycetota bacterium]